MKLRKFISALAVGVMLISSLTVTAFASSPDISTSISDEAKAAKAAGTKVGGNYIIKDGVDVDLPAYVSEVDDATAESAVQAAHKMFGSKSTTLAVFNLTVDEKEKASKMGIRLLFSEIRVGAKIHFIHYDGSAWNEVPEVRTREDGKAVVEFTSLSPVAIVVEGTSSVQTGETLPIMTVVGLICLVGAAFCVSKFKFAK